MNKGVAVWAAGLGSRFFQLPCPALPTCAHQRVPEIVQMPFALNVDSYSAFHTGPHLLRVAHPLPSASQHDPGREQLGLGPVLSLLSPTAAATEAPQLGPDGRGAEQPAPSLAGVWGLGSNLWLPAWFSFLGFRESTG